MNITKLIEAAAALPPYYADVAMLAADEIKALRAMVEGPELTDLRMLRDSVRGLITALVHSNQWVGEKIGACEPDGTLAGDLYAAVRHHNYAHSSNILSDLRSRYPVPGPVAGPQAGHDAGGELPGVPREVPDGGGQAERGSVCGSADVGAPLTFGEAIELGSRDAQSYGVDMGAPGGDQTWYHMSAAEYERRILEARREGIAVGRRMDRWTPSSPEEIQEAFPEEIGEMLEQARSTTRRNILAVLHDMGHGLPRTDVPEQDIAVAIAALRKAVGDENAAERNVQELERQLIDVSAKLAAAENYQDKRELVLRDSIKSRDGQIKALQGQVDKLARHIAFGVAK